METQGWVAPGWEGVRAAFDTNLAEGREVGAAFSAYHDGRKVVDLWGGITDRDTQAPWQEDTLVPVYSTTKGVTAMAAMRLVQEGRLDLDAPVVEYWPEFGQAGKDRVPVRWLLSHRTGLPYVDVTMTPEDMFAWDPIVDALAAQVPLWEPGTQHGYHATTYGWLVGELIRRITGMSVGTYVRKQLGEPLGLDLWIGLPEAEEHRVATLNGALFRTRQPEDREETDEQRRKREEIAEAIRAFMGPDTLLGKALTAPAGALVDPHIWNSRAMHAAEIPAANAVTDARSLARIYAACLGEVEAEPAHQELVEAESTAAGGSPSVSRILDADTVARAATQETEGPDKVLLDIDVQHGLGFMVPSIMRPMPAGTFGHPGMGGSVGWGDPRADLAVGYVMNRLDLGMLGDQRSTSLIDACYAAIEGREGRPA